MSTNLVAGAIDVIKDAVVKLNNYKQYTQSSSLLEVTKVARVEPLCFLDTDCLNHSSISDVIWSAQSIFSGYYLQAISLLGTSLDGVSIAKKLDPLNPNRSMAMLNYSSEAYKYKLPNYASHDISMENNNYQDYKADGVTVGLPQGKSDLMQQITENHNLSVGKLYNVVLGSDEAKATIPVSIRLIVNTVPSSLLVNLFSHNASYEYDIKERWHAYRSGELSFWKDLVFCNDLIQKHRNQLIKDKTGVFGNISKRDLSSKFAGIAAGSPSLATASNIAIISLETAKQIEIAMRGKLSSMNVRDQIFDNTNLMILIVFDKVFDRVTYYYRGINEHSEASINQIKSGNKEDNTMEFVKAFLQGNAAAL